MFNNGVLLTMGDVTKWREEDAALTAQIAELQAKREFIRARLAAVELIVGRANVTLASDTLEATAVLTPAPDEERMIDAIQRIVEMAFDPMTTGAIKRELSKNEKFKERLDASPNYLYTALSRLVKKGVIERGDGGYMSVEGYEASDEESPDASEAGEE